MAVSKGKIKDRYSDTGFFAYVLLLEDDNYYVGVSEDPEQRFSTHKKQGNSASVFTRQYKALKILEIIDLKTKSLEEANKYEDYIAFCYMKKHKPRKVRGGRFSGSNERVYKKFLNYVVEKGVCDAFIIPPPPPKGEQTLLR